MSKSRPRLYSIIALARALLAAILLSAAMPQTALPATVLLAGTPLATPLAEPAADPRDVEIVDQLVVGHWVEVRGQLHALNHFFAERIAATQPKVDAQLWGEAEVDQDGTLRVLGRPIETSRRTEWRNGDQKTSAGERVRVRGRLGVRGRIVAERIEVREPGTSRILGRIDAIRQARQGGLELEILGFRVTVPNTVKQRTDAPIATLERTAPTPLLSPFAKIIDPDDLLGDGFALGRDANLNLTQDISFNSRRNFEIDRRDDSDVDARDDRDDSTHNLRALLTWTPSARVTALVDGRHRWRKRDLDRGVSQNSEQARLAEAWLLIRDIGFGIDLQVGRKDYDEPREWLYDQNLDGVRLFKQTRQLHIELGFSTTLADGSRSDEDALNSILYVSNRTGSRHLAGYLINRNYGDGRDVTQTHYGLRAFGPILPGWRGWAELSGLDGERVGVPISAWGTDLGASWSAGGRAQTTLSVGYAFGSGDRPGGTNTEFRQTGLQDNDARLGGLSPVRYYGELLDPELSNLEIVTIGVAARFLRRTSVELIGHTYRQAVGSDRLRNTSLDRDPTGASKQLGWEIDLVVSMRQLAHWDVEVVAAHFDPGAAFPVGDSASLARLQVRYRY